MTRVAPDAFVREALRADECVRCYTELNFLGALCGLRARITTGVYCVPSPPGAPPPRFQGVSIMACPAPGEACRIGSTPLTRVIAVCGVVEVPSVASTITASPFCRFMSANVVDGMRLNIR